MNRSGLTRFSVFAAMCVAGAFMLHVGIFWFINIDMPPVVAPASESMSIDYSGQPAKGLDESLLQMAELNDSAPLFMPTRWNRAASFDGVASLRAATEVFSVFSPDLHLSAASSETGLFEKQAGPDPATLLPRNSNFTFSRFGMEPVQPGLAAHKQAVVRVVPMGGMRDAAIPPVPVPGNLDASPPDSFWEPPVVYLQVASGRPVGRPVLARGSGFPEWDQALLGFLQSSAFYRVLDNGYFRITVYP